MDADNRNATNLMLAPPTFVYMLVLVLLLATMMFRCHSCIDMSRQRSVPEAGQSTEPRQRPGPELGVTGPGGTPAPC